MSALLYHGLRARGESDVNWCGFYVRDTQDGALTLGPFQGEVACVDIPPGKGVCGAAAERKETMVRGGSASAAASAEGKSDAKAMTDACDVMVGGAERARVPGTHRMLVADERRDRRAARASRWRTHNHFWGERKAELANKVAAFGGCLDMWPSRASVRFYGPWLIW